MTAAAMDYDYGSVISTLADTASLLGLVISSYVALTIRSIQRKYALIGRGPELVKALRTHATVIIDYQQDPTSNDPRLEIALVGASEALASLKGKLGWLQGRSVTRAIRSIEACQGGAPSRDQIALVFREVHGVSEKIDHILKDRKWLDK